MPLSLPFAKGDIVLVLFPLSEEEEFKTRPALILAVVEYSRRRDYLLSIITTQVTGDPHDLLLDEADIMGGQLSLTCYLRPCYTFTAGEAILKRRLGKLNSAKINLVIETLIAVLSQ